MFKKLLFTLFAATNLCSAQIIDFNTDGDFEGFTGTTNCTTTVANGYLTITPTGDGTAIAKVTNTNLGVDADANKYIHFFYKNLSDSSGAGDNSIGDGNDQLRFEAANGVDYGGNNNAININSTDWEIKTVNLTSTDWWDGTIAAFHLFPRRNNSGSDLHDIQITRIEFSNSASPTPLPGPAYSEDFEAFAATIGNNSGTAPQGAYTVENNPQTGGINSSSKALKLVQTVDSKKWDWPALQIGSQLLDDSNGKILKFKILSETETTFTFAAVPYLGGGGFKGPDNVEGNADDNINEDTFTVAANVWTEIEFDFSNMVTENGGVFTRLDLIFNRTLTRDGDVYYIDDIQQLVSPTLSSSSPTFKNVGVYPNPTSGIIHISDISNIKGAISVTNILGQTVKVIPASNQIDISELRAGIYFLHSDNLLIRKIVKK